MSTKKNNGLKIICLNRKASFNYFLSDLFEAGLVLRGSEIKSVRGGKVSIAEICIGRKQAAGKVGEGWRRLEKVGRLQKVAEGCRRLQKVAEGCRRLEKVPSGGCGQHGDYCECGHHNDGE